MKSSTTTFQEKQNGAKKKKLSLFAIIGLVGIFSGWAQGKAAASAIMLISKRPEEIAKGMVYTAMVETYAVLALLASFLMVNGIQI